MIRSEWLHRQLQQLAQAMAKLMGLRGAGRYEEAERLLDETVRGIFGISASLVDSMPARQLLPLLTGDPESRPRTALMLAQLLRERAELQRARERNALADASEVTALALALEAADAAAAVASAPDERDECRQAVDASLARLQAVELPRPILTSLLGLHEREGRFGKAEDVLFTLLDRDGPTDETVAAGLSFYDRLAARPDSELSAGNLPRAEVQEGARALAERRGAR